jgi:hypothetical protein
MKPNVSIFPFGLPAWWPTLLGRLERVYSGRAVPSGIWLVRGGGEFKNMGALLSGAPLKTFSGIFQKTKRPKIFQTLVWDTLGLKILLQTFSTLIFNTFRNSKVGPPFLPFPSPTPPSSSGPVFGEHFNQLSECESESSNKLPQASRHREFTVEIRSATLNLITILRLPVL